MKKKKRRPSKGQDPYGAVAIARGRGCRKDKMPLGAVVIRKRDKGKRIRYARYVKVKLDGPPARRWILFARWWWEKNRGPVPPGQFVIHHDGDELNDDPKNLVLGGHGDRVRLAHLRDAEWSKAQHQRAAAGTSEFNRFNGKLNRIRKLLPPYWYPVVDHLSVVLNVPFRRRKHLLAWFGANVDGIPKSGHGPKVRRAIAEAKVRPIRGRDLEEAGCRAYSRIDPEHRVGTGNTKRLLEEARIAALIGTEIWARAKAAAALDLRAPERG